MFLDITKSQVTITNMVEPEYYEKHLLYPFW